MVNRLGAIVRALATWVDGTGANESASDGLSASLRFSPENIPGRAGGLSAERLGAVAMMDSSRPKAVVEPSAALKGYIIEILEFCLPAKSDSCRCLADAKSRAKYDI